MMMNGVLKTKRPETDGSFGRFAGLNTRREIWTSAGTRRNSFPASSCRHHHARIVAVSLL